VATGSRGNLVNVTISNNRQRGVYAHDGASLHITNQLNGADASVEISGNDHSGIEAQGASITARAEGSALIRIHHNGEVGGKGLRGEVGGKGLRGKVGG
jgi:hypothetical protein